MAWSWFRRRADRPRSRGVRGGPPGNCHSPGAGRHPADGRGPCPPTEDWQELPACSARCMPLSPVAPLDAFTTGLAAHQNPSFLAPLGHRVDPDGPGGLVNGLASVRPGHSIPYAAATALAVPTPSKPRQTVQRHSITWSTPAAATPADASAVAQDNAALVEENPSSSPVPASGDPTDTDVSDRVSPTAPARRTAATALPSPLPGATAESHSGSTEDVVQTTVPASAAVDTEVVTPEPAPTTSTEGQVVPLLGAPDVVSSAAPLTAGPEPGSAEPPRASTPLPVSRLAEGTGTVQPTGRPVTAAQPPASEGGQAGASPPTISSAATPVPILQRRLAAVPERGPRTGVLPPPFTVELPVVASPVVEPPAAAGSPSDGLLGGASSDTEPAPTVGLTAPVPTTAPSSSQQPTPDSGQPVLDLPTAPTAGPEPAATGEPQAPDLPIARIASSPEPVLTADPEPAAARPEPETAGSEPAELTAPLSGFAARIASLTSPPAEAPPADAPPTVAPGPLAPPIIQRLAGPALSPQRARRLTGAACGANREHECSAGAADRRPDCRRRSRPRPSGVAPAHRVVRAGGGRRQPWLRPAVACGSRGDLPDGRSW